MFKHNDGSFLFGALINTETRPMGKIKSAGDGNELLLAFKAVPNKRD